MKKVEAFRDFGVTLTNDRWGGCGVSSAGYKVFTAWTPPPQFYRDKETGLYVYEPKYWDGDKPGTKEIAALLAQVQPSELFKVIAIEPVNAGEHPWQVEYAKPMPGWWRLAKFTVNGATVSFRFEQVTTGPHPER
jgi:hypothetical protein